MRRYLLGMKQYYWVPLACLLIASLAGGIQTLLHKPAYHVSSLMLVKAGASGDSFSPSLTPSQSIGVAANYASEIMSRSVMDFVFKNTTQLKKREYTTDELLADISTFASPTAATVSIMAKAPNPSDAVLLANSVANGFEAYLQQQLQEQLDTTRTNLNNQLNTYLQDKVSLQKQIQAITNNNDPYLAAYQADLQNDNQIISQLQSKLTQLPTVANPNVSVMQLATNKDVTPESNLLFAAAGVVGLLIGTTIMLLIIFLDNRLYTQEEVNEKLGFAYLGAISDKKKAKGNLTRTISYIQQDCKDICTNLLLTGLLTNQPHTPHGIVLLITSTQSTEGKTCVAAALATTLAQGGSSVVVVDGNLRRPVTHLAFGMSMVSAGLGSLLSSPNGDDLGNVIQTSSVLGLCLLPAGERIDDPSFLLDQKLHTILSQLREKTDWVIIDGPSLLSSADASLIASMADGIVLVVDGKHSKLSLLLRAKEILLSVTHKPVGVVLNRFPIRQHNRYYVTRGTSSNTSVEKLPDSNARSHRQFVTSTLSRKMV